MNAEVTEQCKWDWYKKILPFLNSDQLRGIPYSYNSSLLTAELIDKDGTCYDIDGRTNTLDDVKDMVARIKTYNNGTVPV